MRPTTAERTCEPRDSEAKPIKQCSCSASRHASSVAKLVRQFAALRPTAASAAEVVAPPYDVVSADEARARSEEHTSELQSQSNLVCRLLLEKKKKKKRNRVQY